MNGTTESATTRRQGRVAFYHPNSKGTGAALQLDMRINRGDETTYDCFFLCVARQQSIAEGGPGGTPASFDWENKVTVKLGFADVGELLCVLGGLKTAAGKGRGIFHRSGQASTVLEFKQAADTEHEGYSLSVSKKSGDGDPLRAQLRLSLAEAVGLRVLLEQGLFFLTFHSDIASA